VRQPFETRLKLM